MFWIVYLFRRKLVVSLSKVRFMNASMAEERLRASFRTAKCVQQTDPFPCPRKGCSILLDALSRRYSIPPFGLQDALRGLLLAASEPKRQQDGVAPCPVRPPWPDKMWGQPGSGVPILGTLSFCLRRRCPSWFLLGSAYRMNSAHCFVAHGDIPKISATQSLERLEPRARTGGWRRRGRGEWMVLQ